MTKPFRWDPNKNEQLIQERGISFEEITVAVENGDLLQIVPHANAIKYPRQRIMVVGIDGYAFLVPFVEEPDYLFLKTIIPSRKATRNFIETGSNGMNLDKYEEEVLAAFESGALHPIATKEELERTRNSARATTTKDQRINIRLSVGDLRDIQAKAMQEGMPYQTLIASVLHKYVTGKFTEKGAGVQSRRNNNA